MSVAIQRRRGTTSQHSSFTGLAAELTVDTDKNTVVVHDNSTAGGFPLLRQDFNNADAATGRTALVAAGTGVNNTFTAAQRGSITTLTYGATVTPDFDDNNHFTLTLTGNATLANPSNLTAGQSGVIYVIQDGTGSRTLSYGSYWKFEGGTAPTLTTNSNAVDALVYHVRTASQITVVPILDVR